MQKQGQFLQEDFFDNKGGLNISDSPMAVKINQSVGGANYLYAKTGAIMKRMGHAKVNSSADTALRTLGYEQYNSSTGSKFEVRAADTKLQLVDRDVPSFTALTDDTSSAVSDFFATGSTQPVIFNQFNTATNNVLWGVGGGYGDIFGVYSSTKVTKNGVAVPTGAISTNVTLTGGSFTTTGTYFYAVAFRKASTQAISNAVLDVSATIANTTDKVVITLSTITNIDTTKYDKYYIYRSAVSGVTAFTTGDLVAQVDIAQTSYTDTGTSVTSSTNIPRANSLVLDNSVPPTGSIKTMTVFKRCMVVAKGSTIYISDINKPESWPTVNTITIPTGGDITALGIISFSTSFSTDEYLVVFKEQELWVITGTSIDDYTLKFVDKVGCPVQSLLVQANGFISWIDSRGIYLWDGSDKPIYISRVLEPDFDQSGNLDKSLLNIGVGKFYRTQNCILWFLSDKIYGEQKLALRLDLRLTLPSVETSLQGRILDGVFSKESTAFGIYAAAPFITSDGSEEVLILGDDSGYIYKAYSAQSDAGTGIAFQYDTPFLAMGNPNTDKRFAKVIVWVEEVGTWNLTLDYWTGYKSAIPQRSTQALPMSTSTTDATALWDVGQWDIAYWDDYNPRLKALVYNLQPGTQNNSEGECIHLSFRQSDANAPVSILGYSIIYSEKGMNK